MTHFSPGLKLNCSYLRVFSATTSVRKSAAAARCQAKVGIFPNFLLPSGDPPAQGVVKQQQSNNYRAVCPLKEYHHSKEQMISRRRFAFAAIVALSLDSSSHAFAPNSHLQPGVSSASPLSIEIGMQLPLAQTKGLTSRNAAPSLLSADSSRRFSLPSRGRGVSFSSRTTNGIGGGPLYATPPNGEDVNGDNLNGDAPDYISMVPRVYPQRWVQLAYLSLLALLSDWICFSVAASPSTFEAAYPGHNAASLIDIFLFTNVASCFLVTDIVSKFGLEVAIKGAAALMSLGCLLRSGPAFLGPLIDSMGVQSAGAASMLSDTPLGDISSLISTNSDGLLPYPLILAGTIAVGAAQPFFQCTPPMLSATWFASDERATSTAVALNFNQIGIATAFLVGGGMATTAPGLASYFGLITAFCLAVTLGTLLQFQDKPDIPPSSSEIEKLIEGEEEPPFIESVKRFFTTPGFTRPLAAFICSISITNIVGAFIDEVMERGGITEQLSIDLAGAGFELAILVGGIIIGGYVDRTKEYKTITQACLLATMFVLIPLGLTEHALGKEPALLIFALLGLGMAAGPVQPINAELAVDVTYPSDETAVESVQQIGGNLVSALLVPVAELAAQKDYQLLPKVPILESDIRGDVILLCFIAAATYAYFSGFDAPLKRTLADCGDDEGCIHDADMINVDPAPKAETLVKAVTWPGKNFVEELTKSAGNR